MNFEITILKFTWHHRSRNCEVKSKLFNKFQIKLSEKFINLWDEKSIRKILKIFLGSAEGCWNYFSTGNYYYLNVVDNIFTKNVKITSFNNDAFVQALTSVEDTRFFSFIVQRDMKVVPDDPDVERVRR